jgi:peptidyl-prolyl cis-trans isomerase SurA
MKLTHSIFIFLGVLLSGQTTAQKQEVLITIGGIETEKAEFERIYLKNNQNLLDESDVNSPKDYLRLYVDFKLKVAEAMNLKMDTVKTFREELAGYRKELAAPYLTDMNYDESMVRELYERMKKEVNASHILFRLNENASPEEEKEVLGKAMEVRNEIINGMDFNRAAFEYSEDPSARNNRGNLGYFSAFQMVAPFENAAFNTPAGQISEPVRTSFGYHLIKVHEIRNNQGEIQVAHIMKMFPQGEPNFNKTFLKAEIDTIYQALLTGANFAEMAKKHSDDKRSAAQGGEMPWFSAGRMIPEFSEPAFALENTGDMTEPIETAFGYHIIKKTGHRPVPPFEEARANIEAQIKRDPARSSSTKKAFIEKLKKEYGFAENSENLQKIRNLPVNEKPEENIVLFTLDNKNFFAEDFSQYLQHKKMAEGNWSDHCEEWTEDEIIAYEDARLEEKYPDFRYLMQEYHDGLLLFNIMEEKIWNFAAEDSAGLEKFYLRHKDKFMWEERFSGLIITCINQQTRDEAEKHFEAGTPWQEILDLMNTGENVIEIEKGAWEKGSNPVVGYYVWNEPLPAGLNQELTFVRGDKIPPQPKTLNEARGLYISEYQNYLEKNWIKSLRKKYKIKVNKKLLKSIPHV